MDIDVRETVRILQVQGKRGKCTCFTKGMGKEEKLQLSRVEQK